MSSPSPSPPQRMGSQRMTERPKSLSLEGHVYQANHALEVALAPDTKTVPTDLLAECKGVAILSVTHAGALFSLHFGSGVILAKDADKEGAWSAPAAVAAGGYNMGLLAGAKTESVIVFIMVSLRWHVTWFLTNSIVSRKSFLRTFQNDETLKDMATRPLTRLGLDSSLTCGNKGGTAACGLEAPNRGTITFSLTSGAFAGLSVQMGTLGKSDKQNQVFYGDKVTAKNILIDKTAGAPEGGQIPELYKKLDLLAKGETWVPGQDDLKKSQMYLQKAQQSSRQFSSM